MAGVSTTHTNNAEIKFRKQVLFDYLRKNRFSPYMGKGQNSIIQLYYENKEGGDQVNIPLVNTLSGAGVGSGSLVNAEEEMDSYGFRMWTDWARNAVAFKKNQIQKSSFDPLSEARPALTQWGQRTQRDEIVKALLAIPGTSAPSGHGGSAGARVNGTLYSAADASAKNAWQAANEDRILFGNSLSNTVTGNHANSLAAVTDSMTFSANILRLLKRIAQATTGSQPAITPWQQEDPNAEWFLVACGSNAFRDFSQSDEVKQANREARSREGMSWEKNPIFRSGDIVLDGCVVTEIPEIDTLLGPSLATAGAQSARLSPVFLMGQGALAMPWVQNPAPTKRSEDDYGFVKGVGIEMSYGIGKLAKAPIGGGALKDWGVATAFVAAASDADTPAS
jgi:hypothetical protein